MQQQQQRKLRQMFVVSRILHAKQENTEKSKVKKGKGKVVGD